MKQATAKIGPRSYTSDQMLGVDFDRLIRLPPDDGIRVVARMLRDDSGLDPVPVKTLVSLSILALLVAMLGIMQAGTNLWVGASLYLISFVMLWVIRKWFQYHTLTNHLRAQYLLLSRANIVTVAEFVTALTQIITDESNDPAQTSKYKGWLTSEFVAAAERGRTITANLMRATYTENDQSSTSK